MSHYGPDKLIVALYLSHRADTRRIDQFFQRDVKQQALVLEREIMLALKNLDILAARVDRVLPQHQTELDRYAQTVLAEQPYLKAVAWAPVARDSNKLASGLAHHPDGTGELPNAAEGKAPMGDRTYSVPIEFLSGTAPPNMDLTYDLASDPVLQQMLLQLKQSGTSMAFPGTWVDQHLPNSGLLPVARPLYSEQPLSELHHTRYVQGYLVGFFQLDALFNVNFVNEAKESVFYEVVDRTEPTERVLFSNLNSSKGEWAQAYTQLASVEGIPGRYLALRAVPSQGYLDLHRRVLPWLILVGGVVSMGVWLTYLYVPVKASRKLKARQKTLISLTLTDSLTGLANRRHFDQHMKSEWARARREANSFSLILIDIDYFKPYNDLYGHPAGDQCLSQVASALKCAPQRPGDLVARYGGEEFAIVLPSTENASAVAERCRAAVEKLRIPHDRSMAAGFVTISLGICTVRPSEGATVRSILAEADYALYRAKEMGRNRFVVSGKNMPKPYKSVV